MSDTKESPFRIAPAPEVRESRGRAVEADAPAADPMEKVRALVGSDDVFMLIKGTPQRPQCGFSANTVAVMDSLGVAYRTFDVLSDEGVREAAKTFAGWPTFPQVYVRGEFIGGNDIVTEMHASGELQEMVAGASS
jgi:monothiol glutaredoxin